MCGIAGIVDLRERRPVARDRLIRMRDSLSHRGPDAEGLHLEPGVGLGHRRLSIVDLASGQQPMYSPDQDIVVVYNGEIYNFQAIRRLLTDTGHVFRTHCDTEVVLHGWMEWGPDCVKYFNGMFAFALWQRSTETLFLARDRIGIKPLYYSQLSDGHLLFGSELKALLMHPDLPRQLDPRSVEDYFSFGYVPDPKTILSGVHKLSPGHTLCVQRGRPLPNSTKYWDLSFSERSTQTFATATCDLIDRLGQSVQAQLMADVPLGAFLSGGVDSSAVVAMMARISQEPINTCSITFDGDRFDESRFASQVAERYKTAHHREHVDSRAFDLVDQLGAVYDEPYADSSAMPTYRVCGLARKEVKVALSGDGGDENFAGYRRYWLSVQEARLRSVIPGAVRKPLFGILGDAYPKLDRAPRFLRAKSTFESLAMDNVEGYWHGVSIMTAHQRSRLFSPAFQKQLQGYRSVEVFRDHARQGPDQDALALFQYLDFKTYLPGDILTKVDRASMAHGLEVRVPLLDHEFVEWAATLSSRYKMRRSQGKYIFKKALEAYLPAPILYRPKMGFSVPLAEWFRGPLRVRLRDAMVSSSLFETGLFERDTVRRLTDEHQSGAADHAPALWALLMFADFQSRVLDKTPCSPPIGAK